MIWIKETMHRQIYKKAFDFFVFALIVNVVSSTKQESSGWKKVISDFTSVARNFGLREANKPCIEYLRDDNTCMKEWKQGKLWRIVEEHKVPILECNAVSMEDIHHVCQLKTWFVILIILLILIICFGIIGCICCCICFCQAENNRNKQKYAKSYHWL